MNSLMKNRLLTILNLEKISAAQLAQLLSVQRSTLSNLMNGRNNPSYDFILATMTKLPNLNTEWLLTGEGQPYKNPEKNFRGLPLSEETKPAAESSNLFDFPEEDFPSEEEATAYHPFPPLEAGELAKRVEIMQQSENEKVETKTPPVEPSENPKFEEKPDDIPQILPSETPKSEPQITKKPAIRTLEKIALLYSDGSFEVFDAKV